MTNQLKPEISSDWRVLYKPEKTGCYVNDHSLVRAHDGYWHLFGITRDRPEPMPDRERYFTHGRGKELTDPHGFEEVNIVCDNGVRAWAPAVIRHEDRYYMYYGPSPLRFATSDELSHWMENPVYLVGAPLDSCHRDPMVLRLDDGRWLMYATGIHNRYGVVSVFESTDLVTWTFIRYALRTHGNAPLNPPWGATESPFVVEIKGLYYLFVTYTDCNLRNYHNTLVFCSSDPTDFGDYTGDNESEVVVAKLHAHAPEVVRNEDGQWYITTCGWRGMKTPIEGGVGVARLSWR
ncbi:MAG: family 43 glycosylhydrolase [Phycisphaerae bacterium]